ncbi:MAG: phospho-N-acetylmuramoyl-pentapeptide-transferase [Bacteroidetes bacterium]|jgi:phospho-N-acetylmuramoyl-pentapeptide-transferase|nr:phospho-N-acetylmuramoyl-pentapeptide-transferase [Bacteroidota bacterium]
MLYFLPHWLKDLDLPGIGVLQYLSFRAALAALLSLLLSLFVGRHIILWLKSRKLGERIRELGPSTHKAKSGTPTMGGLIILLALLVPTLLLADLTNAYVLLVMVAAVWMGLIGFLDDYIKVFKKNKAGLKGKFKVVGQLGLGLIVGFTMLYHPQFRGDNLKMDADGTLRKSAYLSSLGFRAGDQVMRAGPYRLAERPADSLAFDHYLVKRGNDRLTLLIPEDSRYTVGVGLFGKRDFSFVTQTDVPFFKDLTFNYALLTGGENLASKILYILVVIFIVTAVSNGVNLTDGLDGLAAGTTAIVAMVFAILAYVSGNAIFADYLHISFIPASGELLVFCAALVGACIGFLWFNTYPAQIFMGDTGSLALGGVVGVLALMVKKELLLPIICGVYFVESLSVIAQVVYFKYTKRKYGEGRRIFRMAPLHHHYELLGWHEAKIVSRFWIITVLLALLAFATLKLR